MSDYKSATLIIGALCAALTMLPFPGAGPMQQASAEPASVGWPPFGSQRSAEWRPFDNAYESGARHQNRDQIHAWEMNPPKGFPTLSRGNIEPLKAAIKRYADIVAGGGWPTLPPYQLRQGLRGEAVALLQQRLEITGDLPPSGRRYSGMFDYYVEEAVKHYQYRNGLTPTGVVDQPTLTALNVPASARLRQLRVNLVRLTANAGAAGKRYAVVNIPAAQVEAVEGDDVVSRHAAVVGKIDRQSPVLRSLIHEINFNPFWHVPKSIIVKDLVPKGRELARRGEDVLQVYKMEAYDGSGRKLDSRRINWFSDAVYNYSYRQIPWDENSMGFVKINFHNKHSVYMHDTPSQSLFGRNQRAESSGCVRVHNVHQLVTWLLEGTPNWSGERVMSMEQTGERLDVNLKRRTPVYFVYMTAWATPDGTVQFRRDLYRQDGVDQIASAY